MALSEGEPLIVRKRGGGERVIPPAKWWINRRTPVGENAEIWERMPHEGRREILRRDIIGQPQDKPSE